MNKEELQNWYSEFEKAIQEIPKQLKVVDKFIVNKKLYKEFEDRCEIACTQNKVYPATYATYYCGIELVLDEDQIEPYKIEYNR